MVARRAKVRTGWLVWVVWIVALLATAGAAEAAELDVYGSYWDTDALGDSAGVGAKISFGSGLLGFEARLGYFPDLTQDFGNVVDGVLDDSLDFELEAYPVDLGLNLHFGRGQSVDVFVAGGVTYFMLDTNVLDINDEVGYYGSIGVRTGGTFGFYGEAMYRSVEGTVEGDAQDLDDLGDVVERVDVDLSGPTFNAGFSWRF